VTMLGHDSIARLVRCGMVVGALSLGGCSLFIDDSSNQCRTDSDCERFGNHPICSAGICISSGLGPPGCFFGQPQTPDQFANACSTADCEAYDNCAQAHLCGSALPATVDPPNLGTTPPPVNQPAKPTTMCRDASRANLIFVTGSTNLPPLLQAVAPLLAQNDPPYTVVFQPQTSCKGAGSMFEVDATKHTVFDGIGGNGNWAFYFDANGTKNYCLLGDSPGEVVDVGESDIYAQTCGYTPTLNIADYVGPVQAITFVVPAASPQRSISAEAAHLVFGLGGAMGAVPPWTDPKLFFIRAAGTGTIQLSSKAIDVLPGKWWGIDRLSADNVRDSMEGIDPNSAEKAIGVISSDFADKARNNLRVLSFQGVGQNCGYLPDSNATSLDKVNVRDGHYPIWGPIHLYAQTTNGVPSDAAKALVTRFSVPRLEQQLLAAIVNSGYIPACAMRVKRDQEMGPLASFQPELGCGCFFESIVNGRSNCATCKTSADCPSTRNACNYGFCEQQ